MSEIEWKIEDDVLYVREGGYWLAQEPNLTRVFRAAVEAERRDIIEILQDLREDHKPPGEWADKVVVCRFNEALRAIRARGEG